MTITLREQHRIARVRRLNEASRVITNRLLRERQAHALVLEALDKKKFTDAAAALKKLQGIDFGRMEYFKQAVQRAMSDVNGALGGSATVDAFSTRLGKIISAAQTKLSDVVKNPIPNALAFASALEHAFEQSQTLIQHNFSQQLVLGLKNGNIKQDQVMKLSARKLVGDRADSLENALTQAFMPEGILAKLGLTWKKRYLDPQKAANAIMNAPLADVIKAANSFKQGLQMSDVASELSNSGVEAAPANNGAQTQNVQGDTAAQGIDQDTKEELVSKIAGKTNVGSNDVEKVVDMLVQRGLLTLKK